jgi:hypothetical protein
MYVFLLSLLQGESGDSLYQIKAFQNKVDQGKLILVWPHSHSVHEHQVSKPDIDAHKLILVFPDQLWV